MFDMQKHCFSPPLKLGGEEVLVFKIWTKRRVMKNWSEIDC